MSDSCDPMDCNLPASSVHGFSRREYWSGLPFPIPGDFPDPDIKHEFLVFLALEGGFFITVPPGKPMTQWLNPHKSLLNVFYYDPSFNPCCVPLHNLLIICSSTLAWKIPLAEEPGRLQSMVSQRVRHFISCY